MSRKSIAVASLLALVTSCAIVFSGCGTGSGTDGGNSDIGSGGGSSGGGDNGTNGGTGHTAPAAPIFPDPADGQANVSLQEDARGEHTIVELSWWAPASADRYIIEISRNPSFPDSSTEKWGSSANSLIFVITSAQYRTGAKYYWRVTAYNDYGSTASDTWNFTTEGNKSDGSSGGSSGGGGGSSGGFGEGGSGSLSSNFSPGTYQGLVVQDSEIYSDGILIDTDSRSSSQSIIVDSQGSLGLEVGDSIVRFGITTRITAAWVSDSGDILHISYDAYGIVDGVDMEGSGTEYYTWLASSHSLMYSGECSIHTTNQNPKLEQRSTSYSTLAQFAGSSCDEPAGQVCSVDFERGSGLELIQLGAGECEQQTGAIGLESVDVDLPSQVAPGEVMTFRINWRRCSDCNRDAIIHSSLTRDWSPESPLYVSDAYFTDCDETSSDTIIFAAPSQRGTYRLRWIVCYAFEAIHDFCGEHDPIDAWDPGVCPFVEVEFSVCE